MTAPQASPGNSINVGDANIRTFENANIQMGSAPSVGAPPSGSLGGLAINVGDANVRTFEGATIVGQQQQTITHIGSQQQNITQIGSIIQTTDAKDIKNLFEMGKTAFEGGNYEVADGYFTQVLERDIKNAEAWALRGACNGWLRNFAEGQRYLVKARQCTSTPATIFPYLQGFCNSAIYLMSAAKQKASAASVTSQQYHAQSEQFRAQITQYVTAQNKAYNDDMLYKMNAAQTQSHQYANMAAQSLQEANNHMRWAIDACRHFISVDPYDFTVWSYLHEIASRSGLYQNDYLNSIRNDILRKTAEFSDIQLRKNPDDIQAMQTKIRALNDLGRQDMVVCCYDQLLAKGYERDYIVKKIEALNKINSLAESLDCYNILISKEPTNAQLFRNKIDVLQRLNRHPEAVECYDNLIRLDPQNSVLWMNKGIILSNLNRLQEALQAIEQSIQRYPSSPDAHHHRGVVLEKMGQYQLACDSYTYALQLAPTREDSKTQRKTCLNKWKAQNPDAVKEWKKCNNIGWFD